MFMFGGFDYEYILSMVDSLVYGRRYGGFLDILNNFTVKELLEVFNAIQNKENEAKLQSAIEAGGGQQMKTEELTPEMLRALQA